jgi:glycosyltransferase involved in cell wall biosynthesis
VAYTLSDAVVAVSEEVRALSLKQGCPTQKTVTIWNGIDTTRFRHTGGYAGARIITVGRLEPVKDLATLLRAVSLARQRRGDLALTIVGDGSQRSTLERLAGELGLDNSVRFLGERDDVPALLTEAAIFVNSSISEGVSLSLLEAAGCGLGLIASCVGGNSEVIEDGTTGVLVPPGQPEAFAEAILRLLEGGELPSMGEAARRRAQEHFDVVRMVAAYEAIYTKLLASKSGREPLWTGLV